MNQATSLVHPGIPIIDSSVTRAHAAFAQHHGNGSILTVLLPGRDGCIGAVTLERRAGEPFAENTIELCESLASVIGPALEIKRREERSLYSKGVEGSAGFIRKLVGPSLLSIKLTFLCIAVLIGVLSIIPGVHKITAPASIEGAVKQILLVPQTGFVKEAQVRAGDLVREGELIAALDDSNLKLEALKWVGERNKIEKNP